MIAADIQRFLCASHSLVLLDLVIFNLYENPILLLLCLHLKDKETEAKRVRNWPKVTQQEARSQDVTPWHMEFQVYSYAVCLFFKK